MDAFTFHLPVEIRFGQGVLSELPLQLGRRGWHSIFVISDRGVQNAGLLTRLEGLLKTNNAEYSIYLDVQPNPSEQNVLTALHRLRECKPDAIIGLGGGSVLDTAKLVSVLSTHGGNIWDYQGLDAIPGPGLPVVAIPTTAGTGSEVTRFAVISHPTRRRKIPFASSYLVPQLAIVDPELTFTLPPPITAATGMDALTHAIEALTTLIGQPIADAMALEAIKRISEALPRAFLNPNDVEARATMSLASTMAGIAFGQSFVALAHAIAHALGGLYNLPHGFCCALALPLAMEFNLETKTEKYSMIAHALGVRTAEEGIERVRDLSARLKIPSRLSAFGLTKNDRDAIVQAALEDGSILFNPRPVDFHSMSGLVEKLL